MAQEFTMPKLGLTMTDGTIREWLVAPGTSVAVGDAVLIIETDKVETEVEARSGGVFQPAAEIGENYECGAVIGWLLAEGEDAPAGVVAAAAPAGSRPTSAAAPAAVAPMASAPAAGAGVAGAGVAAVGVAVLDVATRGEGGRILASPRARAAARSQGVELAHVAGTGPGGRIVFDDVAGFTETRAHAPVAPAAAAAPVAAAPVTQTSAPTPAVAVPVVPAAAGSAVLATSGARMLGELLGIDLGVVPVAPGQRATREDVAAWVRTQLSGGASTPAAATPAAATYAPLLQEPTATIPLRGMRGVIAERMHASLTEMAQLTLSVDADMTAIIAERKRRQAAEQPVPGYTAWVIAAASQALRAHPYVNSQITQDGVALLPDVHVGVAVALDDGLIVPVVSNTSDRGIEDIHASVSDLATRARSGKLQLDDLEGGTFSVTALGMYGVDMFTPVINPPNTAILGVGRLRTETGWADAKPAARRVITLSLTWDHRAFDGAPAADFAQTIVRLLENPTELP